MLRGGSNPSPATFKGDPMTWIPKKGSPLQGCMTLIVGAALLFGGLIAVLTNI